MSKNNLVRAVIVSFGAALVSVPAHAVLISFDPVTSTVFEGDNFDVGIRVSGLHDGQNEIVATFDLDVLFDAAIVMATGFTFGDELGPFLEDLSAVINISPSGVADLAQFSFLLDDVLAAAQDDSVLLGSLRFAAVRVGRSELTFGTGVGGSDIGGRDFSPLPVTPVSGAAIVRAREVSVPEPGTLALLGPAVLLLLFGQRRRSQANAIRPL